MSSVQIPWDIVTNHLVSFWSTNDSRHRVVPHDNTQDYRYDAQNLNYSSTGTRIRPHTCSAYSTSLTDLLNHVPSPRITSQRSSSAASSLFFLSLVPQQSLSYQCLSPDRGYPLLHQLMGTRVFPQYWINLVMLRVLLSSNTSWFQVIFYKATTPFHCSLLLPQVLL